MSVYVSGDGFALDTLEDLKSTIERHPVWPISGLHGAHEMIARGLPVLCVPIADLEIVHRQAARPDGALLRRRFQANCDPEQNPAIECGALWEARHRVESREKAELARLSNKYPGVGP